MPAKEYSSTPEEKAKLWAEIVEAAKVVVAKGGGGIKIKPNIEESERLYREMRKHGKKEK